MENRSLIAKYRDQSVLTMSRGELILRLYDEVLKNARFACRLFREENRTAAFRCTAKCRNILNYLTVILDRKYELSVPFNRMYSYLNGQLIRADTTGNPAGLEKAIPRFAELREAWSQSIRKSRIEGGERKPGNGA